MLKTERILYEQRIDRFIGRLKESIYEQPIPFEASYCKFKSPPTFSERLTGQYRPVAVGDTWGKNWELAWFHLQGKVPPEWRGRIVAARVNLGGEACIFDDDGTPRQGLSFHSAWQPEFRRDRYIITRSARGDEAVELWIEATATQIFGLFMRKDPLPDDPKRYGHYQATVEHLSLAIFREDIWQLFLDVGVLNDQMRALPEKSVRRARILHVLNGVIDRYQASLQAVAQSRKALQEVLADRSSASDLTTRAVGHAHIDTAWLWPLRESIRKCARTFSSQIALLEQYPDYVFGASQAQHYAFVKEHYPALYRKIRRQIAAGRWEVQGGMWVEADCNLISGESMVRQFLHGMLFFEEEFGVTVKNLWLPDVFGYSAALPQILRRCGIEYLVTQKISWNQFNKFPHNTFRWQGLDGSEVIVHFPPEDFYNSELNPSALRYAQENFAEKGFLPEFLTLFGVGDGGGGPTEEIIETGLRQRDLEGSPRVEFGPAQEMLERLDNFREELPRWSGELYLEKHRGTLTTQAYNKKMNRFLELKLRELEFIYAALLPDQYPQAELDSMWKQVLLHQFHDIIPGSSITLVYKDSRRVYEELLRQTAQLSKRFGNHWNSSQPDRLTLINTLSHPYSRPFALPPEWREHELLDENGRPLERQKVAGEVFILPELPPLTVTVLQRGGKKNLPSSPSPADQMVLENDLIRYEFAPEGTLRRAYDKECRREIIRPGESGNVLNLYEDRPVDWDAWDIDIYYEKQLLEQARLISARRTAAGPLLQQLELNFAIGSSSVDQTVTLAANSKRLEFATRVDWQERYKMLRAGFWVDVISDQATFEIQYGQIRRPTHRNTSWDKARFESVAHRYADLSEQDYGVALLNDCKYGHRVHGNLLDLNLLRSPTYPDPEADRGEHRFTYALLPHRHALPESNLLSEAAQLNQPPAVFPGLDGRQLQFPVSLQGDPVVLEVLKKAERENALILRLYEPHGKRSAAQLVFRHTTGQIFETNLLEREEQPLTLQKNRLELDFSPFELKTLKVVF